MLRGRALSRLNLTHSNYNFLGKDSSRGSKQFAPISQDKTRTAAEVATEIDLHPAILYPLLRALASLGVLRETPERGFILTERGALLRTDVAGSLRYLAMLEGGIDHRAIWECVPAEIKEGHQLCPPDPSLAATQSDSLKEEPLETEEHQNHR